MTVERILVDTNVLVYHLGGRANATRAVQGVEIHISFITEIELLSKASLTEADLRSIKAAMANYRISDVNLILRSSNWLRSYDAPIA
jgi:predicted nucleic acid-binding protein